MPECDTCTRTFRTHQACNQHMNDTDHWAGFECNVCTRVFGSTTAVEQHMSAVGHWSRRSRPPKISTSVFSGWGPSIPSRIPTPDAVPTPVQVQANLLLNFSQFTNI
jgi:hypothetical protein